MDWRPQNDRSVTCRHTRVRLIFLNGSHIQENKKWQHFILFDSQSRLGGQVRHTALSDDLPDEEHPSTSAAGSSNIEELSSIRR
ncbi:hypothetical protein FKM82_007924 [Ascaphus truei]